MRSPPRSRRGATCSSIFASFLPRAPHGSTPRRSRGARTRRDARSVARAQAARTQAYADSGPPECQRPAEDALVVRHRLASVASEAEVAVESTGPGCLSRWCIGGAGIVGFSTVPLAGARPSAADGHWRIRRTRMSGGTRTPMRPRVRLSEDRSTLRVKVDLLPHGDGVEIRYLMDPLLFTLGFPTWAGGPPAGLGPARGRRTGAVALLAR